MDMMTTEVMESAADLRGQLVIRADLVGTLAIVASGLLGALSDGLAKAVTVPVSAATGLIGILAFGWSYFAAVERSRQHEISVSQLYFVAGAVAPPRVKRTLQRSLWVQVVVAIAVMAVGFSRTKPQEFNWAACIIVVPLFGMGLNGIWTAKFGSFGPRILVARPSRVARPRRGAPGGSAAVTGGNSGKASESHDSSSSMQQNEQHG